MIVRGEVTSITTGTTAKGKAFQVIHVLEREGFAKIIRVKDYGCNLKVVQGQQVEIQVWVDAYQGKAGIGINIIASTDQVSVAQAVAGKKLGVAV